MKTRNRLIAIAAVVTAAAGLTTSAFAHDGWRHHGRHGGYEQTSYSYGYRLNPIDRRLEGLKRAIRNNRENGRLSWREADRLEGRVREISQMKRQYGWTGGGLSDWEAVRLNEEMDRLSAQIGYEGHDRNRW